MSKKQAGFKSVNRSILDASWGILISMITYKAEKTGKVVIKVNPAYTSQDCSKCSYREKKSLSQRIHKCSNCGYVIDRDVNAALNINKKGIEIYKK